MVSLEEIAAIEQGARAYFTALGDGDFDRLRELSTGELSSLATLLETLDSAFKDVGVLRPVEATLDGLEVVSVTTDEATVNVKGTMKETYFDEKRRRSRDLDTDITGPVILTRTSPWRVVDYTRDGVSVRDSLSTKARGNETRQGLAVTVKGVDVRPSGTVVVVGITNRSGLMASGNPPVLVAGARRFKTAFSGNVGYVDVKARSKATTGFFFPKGLGRRTKAFRFVMEFFLGCDPVCNATATFDFRVMLAG